MLDRDETVDRLNRLMHADRDAVEAYDLALPVIDDADTSAQLGTFMNDHMRHVTELLEMVTHLGGRPEEERRDATGVLLDVLTSVREVTGMTGALKAIRTAERFTADRYGDAVALDIPAEVHALLQRHRDDEQRHLAAIEERLGAISGARSGD